MVKLEAKAVERRGAVMEGVLEFLLVRGLGNDVEGWGWVGGGGVRLERDLVRGC